MDHDVVVTDTVVGHNDRRRYIDVVVVKIVNQLEIHCEIGGRSVVEGHSHCVQSFVL